MVEKQHLFLDNQKEYDVTSQYLQQELNYKLGKVNDQVPSTIEKLMISRFDILEGQQQFILQVQIIIRKQIVFILEKKKVASVIGFRFSIAPLLTLIPELDSMIILTHLEILKKTRIYSNC